MKSFKQILNYIFCQNDASNVSEDKQEAPVATLPKDEYDGIGEPIKSFLECFKGNPKRATSMAKLKQRRTKQKLMKVYCNEK